MQAQPRRVTRASNSALIAWHRAEGRCLSFRSTSDPWHVLVSEVMLQQTQAARVDAAWPAFMASYPTPARMAAAPVADVVRAWSGLGYNRRAVNLHRAARAIVGRHGGVVPDGIDALKGLPGVGTYTARAVAAIAFARPVAAVDVNVRRVVQRLCPEPGPPISPTRTRSWQVQALADALIDRSRTAEWTHAVMDLGATVCRATAPRCGACPLRRWCGSAASLARTGDRRPPSRPSRPEERTPFRSTSRWLRGRIVQRLRDAPADGWVRVDGPLGDHSAERVRAAIAALEHDGLLERGGDGAVRLPSSEP